MLVALGAGAWAGGSAGVAAAEPPRVVATIKPLHLLSESIMKDVATPLLLLPPGASPHAFSLKPSDARALARADMILWIGPSLETFLTQSIRSLGAKAEILTVMELDGLSRHRIRHGGLWADHDHTARNARVAWDPHVWLDPANARVIARRIARWLIDVSPSYTSYYERNLARTLTEIEATENRLGTSLAPIRETPYLVFHDAFQYFEKRFRTHAVGSISVSPERRPGARRVAEIRRAILSRKAGCVFHAPQFKPALIDTVLSGSGLPTATLDPMGATVSSYPALLESIADALTGCLGRTPKSL